MGRRSTELAATLLRASCTRDILMAYGTSRHTKQGETAAERTPVGIYVDGSGTVWLCRGSRTAPRTKVPQPLGIIRIREDGIPNSDDLSGILAAYKVAPSSLSYIATRPCSYSAVKMANANGLRWISTTTAIAVDHALRMLKITGTTDEQFFVLHQEGHYLSLAAFDWDDGVLEVLETTTTLIMPHERMSRALLRLFGSYTCMHVLEIGGACSVLCSSGDTNMPQHLADMYDLLRKERTDEHRTFKATLHVKSCSAEHIARGAALQSMALHGYVDGFLVLDVLPFAVSITSGPTHQTPILGSTTIPTSRTVTIIPHEGDGLTVEITSFTSPGAVERYPLPLNAMRLIMLAMRDDELTVTIDIDARGTIVVSLHGPDWDERFDLSDIDPEPPATPEGANPPASSFMPPQKGREAQAAPNPRA